MRLRAVRQCLEEEQRFNGLLMETQGEKQKSARREHGLQLLKVPVSKGSHVHTHLHTVPAHTSTNPVRLVEESTALAL